MHELSIAESLKNEVEKIAEREHFDNVLSLTISIGELSGVDQESLSFVLPFVSEDTVLEGTEFIYEKVKAELRCRDCGKTCNPEIPMIICEHCDSVNVEITAGKDFTIKNMEVS